MPPLTQSGIRSGKPHPPGNTEITQPRGSPLPGELWSEVLLAETAPISSASPRVLSGLRARPKFCQKPVYLPRVLLHPQWSLNLLAPIVEKNENLGPDFPTATTPSARAAAPAPAAVVGPASQHHAPRGWCHRPGGCPLQTARHPPPPLVLPDGPGLPQKKTVRHCDSHRQSCHQHSWPESGLCESGNPSSMLSLPLIATSSSPILWALSLTFCRGTGSLGLLGESQDFAQKAPVPGWSGSAM